MLSCAAQCEGSATGCARRWRAEPPGPVGLGGPAISTMPATAHVAPKRTVGTGWPVASYARVMGRLINNWYVAIHPTET